MFNYFLGAAMRLFLLLQIVGDAHKSQNQGNRDEIQRSAEKKDGSHLRSVQR